MGLELATAWVSVRGDMSRLAPDIRAGMGAAEAAVGGMASRLAGMMGVGIGLYELINTGREAVGLAEIQIDAEQRLAATIRATGGAAGFTAEQLKEYAASLQRVTTFGDEVLLGGMSKLLTFRMIRGEVFKRAVEAMTDVAASGFGNIESAAVMLGKALEDPERGMNAMRRIGITVNETERETVKQLMREGDVRGAQVVILKAVENQMHAVARTLAQTDVGRLRQMKNELGDMKEELGKALIPLSLVVEKVKASFVTQLTAVAGGIKGIAENSKLLAAEITHVVKFTVVLTALAALTPKITALVAVIKGLAVGAASLGGIAKILAAIGLLLASEPLPELDEKEKDWLAYKEWYEKTFKATPFRSMMPPGWKPPKKPGEVLPPPPEAAEAPVTETAAEATDALEKMRQQIEYANIEYKALGEGAIPAVVEAQIKLIEQIDAIKEKGFIPPEVEAQLMELGNEVNDVALKVEAARQKFTMESQLRLAVRELDLIRSVGPEAAAALMEVERGMEELRNKGLEGNKGLEVMVQALADTKQEAGFARQMADANETLFQVRNNLSEAEVAARRFVQAGGDPKMAAELGKVLDTTREWKRVWDGVSQDAGDALRKGVMSPLEEYRDEIERIRLLQEGGFLGPEGDVVAARARRKAEIELKGKVGMDWSETRTGFLDFGKKIQDMMLGRSQLELQRKMLMQSERANVHLAGIEKGVNAGGNGGGAKFQ